MGFTPGNWEKCFNMNQKQGNPCARPNRHVTHKKVMGVWYGKISSKPAPAREKPARERKRKK